MAPVVAPPVADPHAGVDRGVIEDANSGRGWLVPTALTAPAGTWSFSDYELFLVSASYAVTNELTIGATTLIPIVKDQPFFGLLTGKLQVVRSGSLRIALQGTLAIVTGSGESFSGGQIGGAATLCLDTHCHSHANLFVGGGFGISDSAGAVPILVGGSVAARLAKRVKLVGEVDGGYIAGGGVNTTSDGVLAWYGLRFTSRNIGVDVGFLKPIGGGTSTDGDLPLGLPFVSFSYRGLAGD